MQIIKPIEWKAHYRKLLQETRQEYLEEPPMERVYIQGEGVQIQVDMVKRSIMNLKNGKASGEGIYAEMLKNGTQKLFNNLTFIINECLNGHPILESWKMTYISSIYKKGDKRNCNNYRGISVTSKMSRLYGRILRDLIEDEYRDKEEKIELYYRD